MYAIRFFPGIVVQLVRAPPCQGGSCGEIKHREDYGSKYSRIYCYCTVHFSSYCLFTYNLCKNDKSK
ncbi:hypothetical protein Lal_00044967 [Lupinus albus]|nr:hypothetical protein Lal_00044967 [Lupinus albus]